MFLSSPNGTPTVKEGITALPHRPWQIVQKLRRQQTLVGPFFRAQLARAPMQPHRGSNGGRDVVRMLRGTLSDQTRNNASQTVPRTALRHRRRPRRIHPNMPVRPRDERALAFQYQTNNFIASERA